MQAYPRSCHNVTPFQVLILFLLVLKFSCLYGESRSSSAAEQSNHSIAYRKPSISRILTMFRQILGLNRSYRQPDAETGLPAHDQELDLAFGDDSWPKVHHRRNIVKKIKSPIHNDDSYRVNLTELQQLHLRQLQRRLLQHAVDLRHGALEPPGWADDLRQYGTIQYPCSQIFESPTPVFKRNRTYLANIDVVQALQDFDYMQKFIFEPTDPFVITGERYIDRNMLKAVMHGLDDRNASLEMLPPIGDWEGKSVRPAPVAGTRDGNLKRVQFKAFRERMALAALGAIFLIVPMWLMVLHNTLYTGLVATTVFICVFGLVMTVALDKPMDVMASTAAYAAVLVVFVGLNTDAGEAA